MRGRFHRKGKWVPGAFGNKHKAVPRPESKNSMKAFTFEERQLLCDLMNYGIREPAMRLLSQPIAGMPNDTLFAIQAMFEKRIEQGGLDSEKKQAIEAIQQKVLDVLNKRYRDSLLGKNAIILDGRPWGPKKN